MKSQKQMSDVRCQISDEKRFFKLISGIWYLVSRIILIAGICYLSSVICTYGAFLDPGWGARPTAIGGAFTSLSNDANGILWNPAGTARVRRVEATFMYAKPYMGLELHSGPDKTELGMHYGCVLYPFKSWGTLGFGVTGLSASDVYTENVYIINYALPVSRIKEFFGRFKPKSEFGGFGFGEGRRPGIARPVTYLGMNIKLLNHGYILDRYTESDPVFEGGSSKNAVSLDFGILVLYKKLSCGIMLRDFIHPNVGLNDEDIVPLETRIGASYRLGNFVPCLDFSYRGKFFNFHSGGEYSLKPVVFRAGVNLDEVAAGLGFCTNLLQLDYSFVWPFRIIDSYGSHRLSLTVRFGSVPEETEEEVIKPKVSKPKKVKIKKAKVRKIKKVRKKIKKKRKEKLNIAVAPLAGKNVAAMDASIISDFIRKELVDTDSFKVLERSNMTEILEEQQFQQTGCTTRDCAVQMGKILNVQRIVVGTYSKLEGIYFISINFVDVKTGEILAAEMEQCSVINELPGACRKLAVNLSKRFGK